MQDTSCRESEGVPRFLSSPPKSGGQGVEENYLTSTCVLDSRLRGNDRSGAVHLCRALGDLQCRRITGKLRFARATHRGVQRGEAPLRSFRSPKSGGQGVEIDAVNPYPLTFNR